MTQPTEPIEFAVSADEITERFSGGSTLPTAVLETLRATCATSVEDESLANHGRDWWPLAMHWALQGKTPR